MLHVVLEIYVYSTNRDKQYINAIPYEVEGVPAPLQAGVEDPWVVYISQGRWQAPTPHRICLLEHPVDLPRPSRTNAAQISTSTAA
jgi:hypothetical protein